MKFVKVDEDAYEVTVNLDTIRRIGEEMSYVDEESRFDEGVDRNEVIGVSFKNAYAKLSQPEATEVVEEVAVA